VTSAKLGIPLLVVTVVAVILVEGVAGDAIGGDAHLASV
jgi:hypothetical protein